MAAMDRPERSRSPRGRRQSEMDAKFANDKTPEQQQVERILVVDFGSQVSHLICRRVREANVYCELRSCLVSAADMADFAPTGIILSGGPHSVYDADAPHLNPEVWKYLEEQKMPILGICYGLQEMCHILGGHVEAGIKREFGNAQLSLHKSRLLEDIDGTSTVTVWMSHGDKVTKLPAGFSSIAHTSNCEFAAVENEDRRMWGVQFHPEVTHTPCGAKIIKNFVQRICGCHGHWTMQDFAKKEAEVIVKQLGDRYCIGAVSGGVDSSVAAALVHTAVGSRFRPFLRRACSVRLRSIYRAMASRFSLPAGTAFSVYWVGDFRESECQVRICQIPIAELFEDTDGCGAAVEFAAAGPRHSADGQLLHEQGDCKPCVFHFYGCCPKDADCYYCHMRHSRRDYKSMRLSKPTRQRLYSARQSRRAAVERSPQAHPVLRL